METEPPPKRAFSALLGSAEIVILPQTKLFPPSQHVRRHICPVREPAVPRLGLPMR